jgi:hypothetical protein
VKIMSVIRKIKDWICGRRQNQYKTIQYHNPGTPEQNAKRLTAILAQDFEWVRDRTDDQCQLIGRFMSIVLLIERKLVRLTRGFDEQIEGRMLGRKIDVYKDFINDFDWGGTDLEKEEYRALIGPIKEINDIRRSMAHNLSKVSIDYSELKQTVDYIKRRRPDLYKTFAEAEDEGLKCIGAVAVFGFMFSDKLARIQCEVQ